jgi:hypothetical protein
MQREFEERRPNFRTSSSPTMLTYDAYKRRTSLVPIASPSEVTNPIDRTEKTDQREE